MTKVLFIGLKRVDIDHTMAAADAGPGGAYPFGLPFSRILSPLALITSIAFLTSRSISLVTIRPIYLPHSLLAPLCYYTTPWSHSEKTIALDFPPRPTDLRFYGFITIRAPNKSNLFSVCLVPRVWDECSGSHYVLSCVY